MARLREDAPAVECRALSVAYDGTPVVDAVDLTVAPAETVAVLGPSGSGKTTLLYAIAGFLPLAGGEVWLDGQRVATVDQGEPPERRPVAMVFQHYGLWPHLDALETVAYPLRRQRQSPAEARRQARVFLEQMRVDHLAARRPAQLSGGEQQRVGLARALARRPRVYLLDEPTAHLDTALRAELQDELARRRNSDSAAAIIATHDVEEALALADRVVLLRAGRVIQTGAPADVYARPVDEWAARLTGPAAFVDAALERDDGRAELIFNGVRMPLADLALPGSDAPAGERRVMVRPEWVAPEGPLAVVVDSVRFRGSHTDYTLTAGETHLVARWPGMPRHATGDALGIAITSAWPLTGDVPETAR